MNKDCADKYERVIYAQAKDFIRFIQNLRCIYFAIGFFVLNKRWRP